MIAAGWPAHTQAESAAKPRDYLSYSAVRTFQSCPLKYRFRYVDGLPEECVSSSLVFGSAVHAAVEFYYRQLLIGDATSSLDVLMEVYRQSWKERSTEDIRYGKTESAASLDELAQRMLVAFLESDLTQPYGRIIGIEEEVRGELVSDIPDLLGRIDLLLESDKALVVQDFKTSRSVWRQDQAEEQSDQLLLYAELARRLLPGKTVKLQFAVVTKAKQPQVQLLETTFDESRLDRTKSVFQSVWSAIRSGHFYPAPSPMQCPSCGYRSQCRAWRGDN